MPELHLTEAQQKASRALLEQSHRGEIVCTQHSASHSDAVIAIGDIHGRADLLCDLLAGLGWVTTDGEISPPGDEYIVFLGDLVDRGEMSRQAVAIARAICSSGAGQCILGNHEFNAVMYHWPDPEKPGEWLRPHNEHNEKMACSMTQSYAGFSDALEDDIAWFRTLPLVAEVNGLQCVHACWDPSSLQRLKRIGNAWYLPRERWLDAGKKGTADHALIELLCKGPEAVMPNEGFYFDKDKKKRTEARVAWWNSEAATWGEYFRLPGGTAIHGFDPDDSIDPGRLDGEQAAVTMPTAFGHYWFSLPVRALSKKHACLDFSAVNTGVLAAYRHPSGGESIIEAGLVWVAPTPATTPQN